MDWYIERILEATKVNVTKYHIDKALKGGFKMQERRSSPRWQMGNFALYEVLGEEESASRCFLQDINLRGAKVYLKRQVDVHSEIKLEIRLPEQIAPILTEAEVIWQNASPTEFTTGIRFIRFKPFDRERVLEYFNGRIKHNWWR